MCNREAARLIETVKPEKYGGEYWRVNLTVIARSDLLRESRGMLSSVINVPEGRGERILLLECDETKILLQSRDFERGSWVVHQS